MSASFEDEEYNLDLGGPTQEVSDYAKEHWGETDESRPAKIQEFRKIIEDKGEIKPERTDDAFLLRFLRARNFRMDPAYGLLVNYCNFKEDHPELHEEVHTDDFWYHGKEGIYTVLPYREQTGRRIMVYKIGNWDPSKTPLVELFRAAMIMLEVGVLEERSQILGGVVIFDLSNLSVAHAWQVTPSMASTCIQLIATSFPLKCHAFHIIFESWVFSIAFNFFKPFLSETMKKKLFIHGSDVESLHQHIDPKYLPKKYGGIRSNNVKYKKWVESFRRTKIITEELRRLGYNPTDDELTTAIADDVDSSEEEDSSDE